MKLGKWIGGGLGWAFAGPIGAILGFAIGSVFDMDIKVIRNEGGSTTQGDFMLSLLVLVAAVMKADGKVLKSELDYVKSFLKRSFGEQSAAEALLILRDLLKKDIPIEEVTGQIATNMNYSQRLQLLHLLYGVAASDSEIAPSEISIIESIAIRLRISPDDIRSIKAMFVDDTDSAYKILELTSQASDEEVKKAYRKLAKKHHPDMVSNLGPEIQKASQEKFRKINEAYEMIKKQRGIV